MEYTIGGEIAQNVRLDFAPGEAVWASNGSLMAHSKGMQWRLRVPSGFSGALRRSFAGEGISLTYLETDQPEQYVLLASNMPGRITLWDLADGPVVATRGSFLAAWGEQVDIDVTIARRAGAALFGGAGLFLQRVSGQGQVLIHGSGDFHERQLAPGEQILVSTGNLAAFADSVDYDIQGVGGCSKMLFSGEGLFMTRLTGPGRVLLQTLKRGKTGSSAGSAGG
ncbi:MAG: AIM24 family protein [Chloroflexaceae bacterium]